VSELLNATQKIFTIFDMIWEGENFTSRVLSMIRTEQEAAVSQKLIILNGNNKIQSRATRHVDEKGSKLTI
jgi:hypothetical protein